MVNTTIVVVNRFEFVHYTYSVGEEVSIVNSFGCFVGYLCFSDWAQTSGFGQCSSVIAIDAVRVIVAIAGIKTRNNSLNGAEME